MVKHSKQEAAAVRLAGSDHHVAVLHHELLLSAHVSFFIILMHVQLLPAALPVLLLRKVQMP